MDDAEELVVVDGWKKSGVDLDALEARAEWFVLLRGGGTGGGFLDRDGIESYTWLRFGRFSQSSRAGGRLL